MMQLLSERDLVISVAESMIQQANRDFDRAAVPLGKQINQLKAEAQAAVPVVKTVKHRRKRLDGLTDQERDHFYRLLNKKDGKHA